MKRIILLFCIFCQWMYVYSINAIDTNLGQCTSNGRGIMLSTHDGGLLCVEMVRPDIVRVRYSLSGELTDINTTGICVSHVEECFSVGVEKNDMEWQLLSDSLCVVVPMDGSGIVFRDRRTNRIIGMEKPMLPRSGERIVEERIIYDDATQRMVQGVERTRKVYLPKTGWYDFWTGKFYSGGQDVIVPAPIDRIPLFVRQGSILPLLDEPIEWSDAADTTAIALRIYPGQDAVFTLYEDRGDGYQCENGEFSTITLKWNDKRQTLYVGERKGAFHPAVSQRQLRIYIVGHDEQQPVVRNYRGKSMKVKIRK